MPLLTRPSSRRSDLLGRAARAATPARLALGRTGAGAVMVARPRLMPETMGVDSASAAKTGWVVQMLGAREIALGLGTLASLRSRDGRATRTWLLAGVLSDGLDVLAVGGAVAKGRLSKPVGGAVVLTALGATFAGLQALNRDDQDV